MQDDKNVEIELELTYLAAYVPNEIAGTLPKELMDVYIPTDPAVHSKLRLRRNGEKYEITKKVPLNENDASAQQEFTIPVTENEFIELAQVSNKRIRKDRYQVMIDGRSAEVDVFLGELSGLILLDFEFTNEEEKCRFVMPECCLADVTQEEFIAGGELAGKTYADIQQNLSRFNYTRLHV